MLQQAPTVEIEGASPQDVGPWKSPRGCGKEVLMANLGFGVSGRVCM